MTKEKILEKILHEEIPITRHLNLKVSKYDGNSLVISAPLKENRNDKGIAFAGSLYSIGALCGWGILTLKLMEEKLDAKVVISKSEVKYTKPMKNDFLAICNLPEQETWFKIINRIKRKGNNKIPLEIKLFSINEKNEHEAILNAEYMAWIEKKHENY